MKGTILVVEDEEPIVTFLQPALEREGFSVAVAETGEEAIEKIEASAPDLVILDIMLPGIDGWEVCRQIRAREGYIPIIMLTARDEEVDKVVGLELGADDYVAKPFSARELVARIGAVLRLARLRSSTEESREHLVVDELLQIDLAGRVVYVSGQPVELTPKEYDLLVLMARNRGRVFGRESLLERVWGYDYLGDSHTVDVHVQRLRGKIEPDTKNPRYILTVRSIGYKFARPD